MVSLGAHGSRQHPPTHLGSQWAPPRSHTAQHGPASSPPVSVACGEESGQGRGPHLPALPDCGAGAEYPDCPPLSPHVSSSLLLSSSLLCSSCALPASGPGSAAGGGSAGASSWGTFFFCPFLVAFSGEREPLGEKGLRQTPLHIIPLGTQLINITLMPAH